MTSLSTTQLYSILSEKVGKEAAENLTVYMEDKIKDEINKQGDILATKQDLFNLELKLIERIGDIRVRCY